jgi:hypothetical protein
VVIGHDRNPAVNIIGEKVRDKRCLSPGRPPFAIYMSGKLWCIFPPVLRAERTESLDLRFVIVFEVKSLRLDGSEMRIVGCPARERVDTDLKWYRYRFKLFSRVEKGTLRFNDFKLYR